MNPSEVRETWRIMRDEENEYAIANRDSPDALRRMAARYELLPEVQRPIVIQLLIDWLKSDDSTLRFDAEALISHFRIAEAVQELRELRRRLEADSSPEGKAESRFLSGLEKELSDSIESRAEVREIWAELRDEESGYAIANKDSHDALRTLTLRYQLLPKDEKPVVNELLIEWLHSANPGLRFDSEALIRTFHIREAIPSLTSLAQRMEAEGTPRSRDEREKILDLIQELSRA